MDISQFKTQIAKLTPVSTLSQKNFTALLDSMQLIQLHRGDKLFTEGQEDKSHYFLLQGSISIRTLLSVPQTIEAGSPEAMRPLDHFQPRKHTASAKTDSICLRIDSQSLEMMLSWQQSGDYEVSEINDKAEIAAEDWMARVLKNPIFQNLPANRLQLLFMRLVTENCRGGDIIFSQGDPGKSFFIVASGRLSVLRNTPKTPHGTPVAQLIAGDTFGEDALLSNEPRNASVQALEDATIMRLSKNDFAEIIQRPVSDTVDFMEAADLVSRNKAKWVDVRQPSEFGQNHLDNSINLPLLFMRLKVAQLDRNYHYVVCCNDGQKSSAGAYLMKKHGLHARILEGGLESTAPH